MLPDLAYPWLGFVLGSAALYGLYRLSRRLDRANEQDPVDEQWRTTVHGPGGEQS